MFNNFNETTLWRQTAQILLLLSSIEFRSKDRLPDERPCFGNDLASKLTGPEIRLKLLRIGADCDLIAMRAAALDLQQADELARAFAESNTKRLIGSADLIRSPDTSRSSP